jgi:Ni,Fe-hydrogenase III small subunit/Pyruvate/2-oxoacid:ferredoxin oxidoreductase delta subunit
VAQGVATQKKFCPPLSAEARGLPVVTYAPCDSSCTACSKLCPTKAIAVDGKNVALDLGACIGCGLCYEACPTDTIAESKSTQRATRTREELLLTNDPVLKSKRKPQPSSEPNPLNMFRNSLHARVVSTGCSATDAEIGASGNPIFDIDRLGLHIVASPRYADALFITGPVSKGMQTAVLRCYEAMPEPKCVVAVGTCAISGGLHRGGYAEASGITELIKTSLFIPGCPPHPWMIIYGVLLAMGREDMCVPDKQEPVLKNAARA